MTLGINQPYFLPYIGYFQLINIVDIFIIADDFQYTKKSWINRNRVIDGNKIYFLSLPIKNSSCKRNINQHFIQPTFSSLINRVENSYHKAPFYKDVFPLFKNIIDYKGLLLSHFLLNSLKIISQYLDITTPIILNSTLNETTSLKSEERAISICKSMGADIYINAIGGQLLYNREKFAQEVITLKFINPQLRPYKQLRTQEFVPALSILDVMMNVPRDEIRDMLNDYTLI